MPKIEVVYYRERCIGNGSCAAIAPGYFKLVGKKADLLDSRQLKDKYVANIECNEADAKSIIDAGIACPVNAIQIINSRGKVIVATDIDESDAKIIIAKYDEKEFVIDKKRYFLVRINRKDENIELALCDKKNHVVLKIIGKRPLDMYHILINKESVPISKDHAAYVGKELQKAYIAMENGLEYIQDEELDFSKKYKA